MDSETIPSRHHTLMREEHMSQRAPWSLPPRQARRPQMNSATFHGCPVKPPAREKQGTVPATVTGRDAQNTLEGRSRMGLRSPRRVRACLPVYVCLCLSMLCGVPTARATIVLKIPMHLCLWSGPGVCAPCEDGGPQMLQRTTLFRTSTGRSGTPQRRPHPHHNPRRPKTAMDEWRHMALHSTAHGKAAQRRCGR